VLDRRVRVAFFVESYDLYFLALKAGKTWDEAMTELEEDDEASLEASPDLASWQRIRDEVIRLLPAAEEEFVGDEGRELSDAATGVQLSMFKREVSLTVPYWHSGGEADRVVRLLREIVAVVEDITGLTAYDPQSGSPFRGGGETGAAETMDRTRTALYDVAQDDQSSCPNNNGGDSHQPVGLWSRLFGRASR
jgi:hypothetical protein